MATAGATDGRFITLDQKGQNLRLCSIRDPQEDASPPDLIPRPGLAAQFVEGPVRRQKRSRPDAVFGHGDQSGQEPVLLTLSYPSILQRFLTQPLRLSTARTTQRRRGATTCKGGRARLAFVSCFWLSSGDNTLNSGLSAHKSSGRTGNSRHWNKSTSTRRTPLCPHRFRHSPSPARHQ